jgi:GTP cyclohydrolase II
MALPLPLPAATIRTQVALPLRLADGYSTDARVFSFDGLVDGCEHLAFALGGCATDLKAGERDVPLIRPHSECLTGDVFGSQRCDCGPQLREAVKRIADVGGYLLYLRQEGRGIGLYSKLDAYTLQETGVDTYDANLALGHGEDERSYVAAAQMLHALQVSRVALLSNNPDKARQLRSYGVTVVAQVRTGVHVSDANVRYLETKVRRGKHTLDLSSEARAVELGAAAVPEERSLEDVRKQTP